MQTVQDSTTFKNALGQPSTETHRHVAEVWQRHCVPVDQLMSTLREKEARIEDIWLKAQDINLDGDFKLNGMSLTPFALTGLARYTDCPAVMLSYLTDKGYSQQAADHLNREIGDLGNRQFLVRTIGDATGTTHIRAFCSDRYAVFDNADALQLVVDAFPRGAVEDVLACHIDDDGDSFRAMLLTPDYIQTYPDSDYGVGVSLQNSEVGLVPFGLDSMSFRAVCQNGCVHGSAIHGSLSRKHQGKIDLNELRLDIKRTVVDALDHGRDAMRVVQYLKTIQVPRLNETITMLSRENGLDKAESKAWLVGVEKTLTEPRFDWEGTAFALVQGLTRSARDSSGMRRAHMERTADRIISPADMSGTDVIRNHWRQVNDRAENVDPKLVAALNN